MSHRTYQLTTCFNKTASSKYQNRKIYDVLLLEKLGGTTV